MAKELLIEMIDPGGNRVLGKLSGTEVVVGRDQADGIVIPNTAVSRSHGVFLKIRNHWFYKDLGSTNGSWRNGKQIKEGQFCIVRPGDVLQLADTPLRMTSGDEGASFGSGFPQFSASTLVVFSGTEFHDEFPLPEYGRALVVGGTQADLTLEEGADDLPRMVVEKRGEKVCAFRVGDGPAIYLNGAEISETVNLEDGDELKIANYTILLNDSKTVSAVAAPSEAGGVDPLEPHRAPAPVGPQLTSGGGVIRSWGEEDVEGAATGAMRSGSGKYTFGRSQGVDEDDVEGTIAIDPADVEARLSGYDLHPSSRYNTSSRPAGSSLQSVEDKLIVMIGFLMLLCLIGLVLWWVMF